MTKEKIKKSWVARKAVEFLADESRGARGVPICDFSRFRFEVRPCDIILVEGKSHLSNVIKTITLSRWTHAAIYIGRLNDIENKETRDIVGSYCSDDPKEPLIIEAIIGEGVILTTLTKYAEHNLRLCRPKYLSPQDAQKTIAYSVGSLGKGYHTRQILDLARFMLPYGVLPRRWRSTLFEHNAGDETRTICSTMLAEAFASVQYPILPILHHTEEGKLRWHRRSSNLFVPSDFDHSPYFDIIKYPFLGDDMEIYKRLPWDKTGVLYIDENEVLKEKPPAPEEPKEEPKEDKARHVAKEGEQ